jgi:hypothetical protein
LASFQNHLRPNWPFYYIDPGNPGSERSHLAGELKKKHEDENDDEWIENGTLEDISESKFDVSWGSSSVCRITELFSLVQEGVEVVFMASKSG